MSWLGYAPEIQDTAVVGQNDSQESDGRAASERIMRPRRKRQATVEQI